MAIDESLYLYDNQGKQIWIVGAVDTKKKTLRMDINSVYTHEVHSHTRGGFGLGFHCTSSIESVWSFIKNEIRALYHIIPHKNYILFLRKAAEYRYTT